MRARRTLPLLAAVAAFVLSAPPAASAAESAVPTAQQKAYGLDWAPFIDPADLPPVEQRKVVCLVDSGVAITEDLPPDRPEGPIVQRIAVDGGSGLPGPKLEHQHGTQMASFAGAVMGNDWGTVGAWPGVRILSVRAMRYDATGFAARDWRQGITTCRKASGVWPVASVNLSLGGTQTVTADERTLLEDHIDRAHNSNLSVVAAAGNQGQGQLELPASVTGMLPVAAGSTVAGALCSYANYVPNVLIGPGCGLDVESGGLPVISDGGGSSSATAFAATSLALLRSLHLAKFGVDASWEDAERWLLEAAESDSGRPVLNVEMSARLAGLGDVVERARDRMPAPFSSDGRIAPTDTSSPQLPSQPPAVDEEAIGSLTTAAPLNSGPAAPMAPKRLPTPKATVYWLRGELAVRLHNASEYAGRLEVSASGKGTTIRLRARVDIDGRRVVRVRIKRQPKTVQLKLLPRRGDIIAPSATATLKRNSNGRYR